MAGRIVLFGATGYTGTLTAEELARVGEPAVLAGRNRSRLGALAHRLGPGFTVAAADVADPASVAELVEPGDVLVSTVGPFTRYGEPALRAAIDRRAHYVDSTGEPGFVRRVFEEFGPQAERAGVVLLTAFGYDCVPGNVAGGLALEEGGPAATQVEVGYFGTAMRPSGGTLASLLGATRAPQFGWRHGRLVNERGGARVARFNLGDRSAQALSFGGSEHFGLPPNYPRLRTVDTYLGWFGPMTRAVQVAAASQALLGKVPGVPGLTRRFVSRVAPGSTGGPDAAARSRARATVVAVARDDDGRPLSSVRLHGVDSYTLTARLLVWAAQHLREGATPWPGARGPIDAFGLDVMARALAGAGLPTVATRRART